MKLKYNLLFYHFTGSKCEGVRDERFYLLNGRVKGIGNDWGEKLKGHLPMSTLLHASWWCMCHVVVVYEKVACPKLLTF